MIRVFDNHGQSFDRYTLIVDHDAFGMSANAQSPQGFNQYLGKTEDIDQKSLGSEPLLAQLPTEVQRAIIERILECLTLLFP